VEVPFSFYIVIALYFFTDTSIDFPNVELADLSPAIGSISIKAHTKKLLAICVEPFLASVFVQMHTHAFPQ
jgi:hypothetical protein